MKELFGLQRLDIPALIHPDEFRGVIAAAYCLIKKDLKQVRVRDRSTRENS